MLPRRHDISFSDAVLAFTPMLLVVSLGVGSVPFAARRVREERRAGAGEPAISG